MYNLGGALTSKKILQSNKCHIGKRVQGVLNQLDHSQ